MKTLKGGCGGKCGPGSKKTEVVKRKDSDYRKSDLSKDVPVTCNYAGTKDARQRNN